MTAYLDNQPSDPDRTGGVSDPRLVNRVGRVEGNTPEELAAAERAVQRWGLNEREREQFRSMLGLEPTTPHGSAPRLKEVA